MTISSTTRKVGPFIGNNTASIFAFPFKVFKPEDILVVMLDVATQVEYVVGTPDGYTVSLNPDQDANPGGSITMVSPLEVGFNIIITSDQLELQETDITNQGGFYPEVITAALDELTIDVQQLREQANRSLRFPISDPPLNAVLPPAAERDGNFLYFEEDGSIGMLDQSIRPFGGPLVGAIDGANRIYTLTNGGSALGETPTQALVWKNFPQVAGVGYTTGPGVDQVTFSYPPEAGDTLYAQGWLAPAPTSVRGSSSGSAILNFGTIPSNTGAIATIAMPAPNPNVGVVATPQSGLDVTGLYWLAFSLSPNVVTVVLRNLNPTPITPAVVSWGCTVFY